MRGSAETVSSTTQTHKTRDIDKHLMSMNTITILKSTCKITIMQDHTERYLPCQIIHNQL